MKASASSVSTSRSIESTSAKRLKSTGLPSITGLEARAPKLPRPRIAVPFEITATIMRLGRVVEGHGGILRDRFHGHRDAGRIGEREVALRRHRLRGHHLELAGAPLTWNCSASWSVKVGGCCGSGAARSSEFSFGRFRVGLRAYAPFPRGQALLAQCQGVGRNELSTGRAGPSAADETPIPLC